MLDLEQRTIDLLIRLPVATTFSGRSALLMGLPTGLVAVLNRSADNSFTDLAGIVEQLSHLGPLAGGVRPVLAVLAAGQRTVPGTSLEKEIASMIVALERAYGREDKTPLLDPSNGPQALSDNELLVFGADRRVPFDFVE